MDPVTMMLIGGGTQLLGGMMGASSSAEQAARDVQQQIDQIDWNNHIQKLQMAQKNRAIAEGNAAKWMNNILITEGAYQAQKEQEVYIRRNMDNETGHYSNKAHAQNQELLAQISTRGVKTGGTAEALKRQARLYMERTQETRTINEANTLRDSERTMQNILDTKRDFNYNKALKYMPTEYLGQSAADASSSAYTAGMAGAVMAGISGGMQGHLMGTQGQYYDTQMETP